MFEQEVIAIQMNILFTHIQVFVSQSGLQRHIYNYQKVTHDSYLLCMSSPMGGRSETHKSRFQMDGLKVMTDNRSTTTA